MTRRIAVALCCAGLLGATALAGDEPRTPACCVKKAATARAEKAGKLRCSLTGKEVEKCCCEPRPGGKLYCPAARKQVDKCCCSERNRDDGKMVYYSLRSEPVAAMVSDVLGSAR